MFWKLLITSYQPITYIYMYISRPKISQMIILKFTGQCRLLTNNVKPQFCANHAVVRMSYGFLNPFDLHITSPVNPHIPIASHDEKFLVESPCWWWKISTKKPSEFVPPKMVGEHWTFVFFATKAPFSGYKRRVYAKIDVGSENGSPQNPMVYHQFPWLHGDIMLSYGNTVLHTPDSRYTHT